MDERAERVAVAERAARAGASVAMESFRSDVPVETKSGKTDVVTQADRDAQRRVVEAVRERFPADAIVGEEGDARKTVPEEGAVWIVDPIDGTSNYVRDIRTWGTAVAAVVDGEAVAAANVFPALDDVYLADGVETTLNGESVTVSERSDPETFTVSPTMWWGFDRRDEYAAACRAIVERFGDLTRVNCGQATLSMVAAGQIEAAVTNVRANPWDTVGGVQLIRRAGGVVTDVEGGRWRPDAEGLVASNGTAHDEVLAATREIATRKT